MHNSTARAILRWYDNPVRVAVGRNPSVKFVSPVVSTIVAAKSLYDPGFRIIECEPQCQEYAEMIGLTEAIRGDHPVGKPGGLHGRSYSRLSRLAFESEVDSCNKVISDVLHNALDVGPNAGYINTIAKVVGELHDNVPSHARGTGFSAAQVYSTDGNYRLEFAIADGGCGMLHNVQGMDSSVATDQEAISWCLQRGNTTAGSADDWEQRMPEDYLVSPFPQSVSFITTQNHHVGEGLWCLTELVREAKGSMWVWSGDAQLFVHSDGSQGMENNRFTVERACDRGRIRFRKDPGSRGQHAVSYRDGDRQRGLDYDFH